MKERDLDEFASLFQRAIIPTIEVEKIDVRQIAILAESCRPVADRIARRFDAAVTPHAQVEDAIASRPSLIIAPHLDDKTDELLVATELPTLLLRGAVDEKLFTKILAQIPGGQHELIEQFSFAFALCEPGGLIRLLHVVEEERVEELARALEVAPEIDTDKGAESLLSAIEARMDHLLRGAVRTAEGAAFTVEGDIEVGDPFEIVPNMARDFTLLIVGSHESHERFLESRAYELIRRTPDLPVLAL